MAVLWDEAHLFLCSFPSLGWNSSLTQLAPRRSPGGDTWVIQETEGCEMGKGLVSPP